MGIYFQTQHLKRFSQDVVSEFDNDKLVVIHIPRVDNSSELVDLLCQNIHLEGENKNEFRNQVYIAQQEEALKHFYGAISDSSNDEHILSAYGHTPPIYVVLDVRSLPEDLEVALIDVTRKYQAWDRSKISKKIVVVLQGVECIPEWVKSPAVRYFQYWNVLSWEEMRTLANEWVPACINQYFREWQISTFTGAANLDPFLLHNICLASPENFSEILEIVTSTTQHSVTYVPPQSKSVSTHSRWKVPSDYEKDWLQGCLTGMSVDRGLITPWSRLDEQNRKAVLMHSVWREQMTSLFPLVAELSDLTAEMVSKDAGSDVWKEKADGREFGHIHEPKVIMDTFKNRVNHLPRVSQPLWDLLGALRYIRNELAHRNYIDSGQIRSLWNLFQNCSK